MKKLLLFILAACLLVGCSSDNEELEVVVPATPEEKPNEDVTPDEPEPESIFYLDLSAEEKAMAISANNFALNLFGAYDRHCGTKDNVALSPLSIQMALSMLANGACGSTYESIVDVLGWNGRSIEDINAFSSHLASDLPRIAGEESKLALANGMWHSSLFPVAEGYEAALKSTFGSTAEVAEADEIVGIVNKWCSDNTNGLIDRLMSSAPEDYTMVLANALYFKSGWTCDFNINDSEEGVFTNSDATTSDVMYMKANDCATLYMEDEKFSIASLPLGDCRFMMRIILPSEGVSVEETIDALREYGFSKALDCGTARQLNVTMPRFEANANLMAAPLISEMGGLGIFDDNANYSLISPMPLTAKDIIHAARVVVNEDGVEGGAATDIWLDMALPGAEPPKPFEFKADRTFLFCITDIFTNVVLFIGRVGY